VLVTSAAGRVHCQYYRPFSPVAADYAASEDRDVPDPAGHSIVQFAQAVIDTALSGTSVPADSTNVSKQLTGKTGTVRQNTTMSPSGALYRSLAVPGWGQWENGRREKAGLFAAAEAFFVGGFLYEQIVLSGNTLSREEKDAARTDRNTFLLYWMAAKVLDIMDAYVDAQFRSYDVSDITPEELTR